MVGVLAAQVRIASGVDFVQTAETSRGNSRRSHVSPLHEPITGDPAADFCQASRIYDRLPRDKNISADQQRDPVQVIVFLLKRSTDLAGTCKTSVGFFPFLVSFQTKTIHDEASNRFDKRPGH
jgi:hypothetical protein